MLSASAFCGCCVGLRFLLLCRAQAGMGLRQRRMVVDCKAICTACVPQPLQPSPPIPAHKGPWETQPRAQIWGCLPGHPAGDNAICPEEASCISVLFKESRWSPVSALKGSVNSPNLDLQPPLPCLSSLPRIRTGEELGRFPAMGKDAKDN